MRKNIKKSIIFLIVLILIVSIVCVKYKNMMYLDNLIIFNLFESSRNKFVFNINSNTSQRKTVNLYSTFNADSFLNRKIAPGSKGEFEIILKSSANINYQIRFENQNQKPQNLFFNIKNHSNKYNTLEEIEKYLVGSLKANQKDSIIIEWCWNYETDTFSDIQDTIDGKSIEKYCFDINILGY